MYHTKSNVNATFIISAQDFQSLFLAQTA